MKKKTTKNTQKARSRAAHALDATIAAALFARVAVWGGWSEAAVAAQIEKLLSAPNAEVRDPAT